MGPSANLLIPIGRKTDSHCYSPVNAWQTLRFLLWMCVIFINSTLTSLVVAAERQIHLEITTHMGDKQTFVEGDVLSFLINLDQDANVLVLYEDASGTLIQILPNEHAPQTLYRSGYFIQVPAGMPSHHFVVAPPFGREHIFAFASEEKFPQLPGQPLGNGLKHIAMKAPAALQLLRDFAQQTQRLFGEASLEITTVAK